MNRTGTTPERHTPPRCDGRWNASSGTRPRLLLSRVVGVDADHLKGWIDRVWNHGWAYGGRNYPHGTVLMVAITKPMAGIAQHHVSTIGHLPLGFPPQRKEVRLRNRQGFENRPATLPGR